jgi:SAM-dependent methyltransferase
MSAGDRLGFEIERFGDRLGVDFLRYNPVVFKMYDRLAVRDSPAIVSALRAHFPGACRVIDVGAGSGAFAAEARRQGLTATAIERSRHGRRLAKRHGIRALHFDLRATPPTTVEGRFDLAYCFEVAEHIPASWPTNSSTSSVNSHRQSLLPPRRQARGGRVTSMNNPPVTGRHVLLPEGTRQHL